MEHEVYEIEYDRWGQVVVKTQLIIAIMVCAIEILNNILLYVTRSQGYGPDTIVQKLFRYLFLTTFINFGLVLVSHLVEKKSKSEKRKRYFLMLFTVLICTDVAFSHYQFAVTLAIFVIPIVISILYEEWRLTVFTGIVSILGNTVAVIARATDAGYSKDIGPEAAISFAMPIAVIVFARIIIDTLKKGREELAIAVKSVEQANADAEKMKLSMNMLETLASTLDAKDSYTNGHSVRVAAYSVKLAKALGWSERKLSVLRYEALLHDIGKIGVPDSVLNKPSRLTEVEFGMIKVHAVVGSDILKNMIVLPGAALVARHHHERYDGKGYPDGLAGEEIPLNARIVCIADAFDAMNSDRIYRKALSSDKIRAELIKGRGVQFDPKLLDKFIELFDSGEINIRKDLEDEMETVKILDDVKDMFERFAAAGNGSSLDSLYIYMKSICKRYDRTMEILQVDIVEDSESPERVNAGVVSEILERYIKKNIRAVDLYYRYTELEHMIILLDAGVDNIEVVKRRIVFDFYDDDNCLGYDLNFTLKEKVTGDS